VSAYVQPCLCVEFMNCFILKKGKEMIVEGVLILIVCLFWFSLGFSLGKIAERKERNEDGF
jgi:predicted permease